MYISLNFFSELAFILGISGISSFFGFGFTIAMAKKSDPTMFSKVGLLCIITV